MQPVVAFALALGLFAQTIPGQLVKKAAAVKDRHAAGLLRLPAVVGAGVGASKSDPAKPAILVYVSRKLEEKERRRFPKRLEGVPVEIHESGPFVALPKASQRR